MKKVLKWIGIVLGAVILIAVLVVGSLLLIGNNRLNKTYSVQVEALAIPSDAGAIAQGMHIASTVCMGCHGPRLSGQAVMNAPGFAVLYSTNLTSGNGGVGGDYKTDTDWIRAIRNGIDPDGKSLLLMPSPELYYFSDSDLANLIAYLKSLPPVDNEVPDPTLAPHCKNLTGNRRFGLI